MTFTMFAIGSSVFGAIANIMAKTLLNDLRTKEFIGLNFITMGVTLLLISPTFYYFNATSYSMFLVGGVALTDTLANYFYFKTLESTEASVATPILSMAPMVTFGLSWVILGDIVSGKTVLLALVVLLLIIASSVDTKNISTFKTKTLLPALITSVLFGFSAIPSKLLLDSLDVINAPTLYMFRSGFIGFFSLLLFNFQITGISTRQFRWIFLRGLFAICQWVSLYKALQMGSAGVVVTLGNMTPVFVLLLSFPFLQEKYSLKKVIAALSAFGLGLLL